MEFSDALRKAAQILDEERVRPTVSYRPYSSGQDLAASVGAVINVLDLREERRKRPRPVHESPDEFRFASTNYELLLSLFSQVSVKERTGFVATLLSNFDSASPLIAEFAIRAGYTDQLLRAIGESPLTQGLVLLLRRLQDTIALNFNLLSDGQLEQLAASLNALRSVAKRKTYTSSGLRGAGRMTPNPEYDARLAPIANEIVAECDCVIEECGQARYWYLKGALQQNANLEINQDKRRVEDYLKRLGFTDLLLQTLNAADQDFRASATAFELKNSLGHLRSFLEELHQQACSRILAEAGTAAPKGWGSTTKFLRDDGILSEQEKNLAVSLFTLISDVGVHPLIAEREYARLLRNMVVEYGLLFLVKLDKKGINLSTEEILREDRSR